jgi:Glyoxalase-like domain
VARISVSSPSTRSRCSPSRRSRRVASMNRSSGGEILLQRVPEAKGEKNRLHLDLRTVDLAGEVEHVLASGAIRLTSQLVTETGWRWHILADPDGNGFCVLQPPAGYW